MLKITLITPQHVTTAFFFFGCKLANQQTSKPGKPGKPGNKPANLNWQQTRQNHRQTRQRSAKEEEEEKSAPQKSEESRCA